jgi:sigma-B regulation protein RsbU (phosphoserine phosphatase)
VTTLTVPPGAVLCFYTDGLVERRHSSLDIGLQRLCEAVVPGPVESVCTSVMGQLIGDTPADDDVALLAMRRHTSAGHDSGQIQPLNLATPA